MAAAKHIELPAVVVPPHLWTRSARPVQGRIVAIVVPGALIVAGILMSGSSTTVRAGLVLAGLGLFLALPAMVIGRLERLGREVQAADSHAAAELLRTLPNKPVVQFFAPLAWRTLQEGILQLKTGDGKAAAANFAETARLVRQPEAVMLLSAQAHALVVAGERAEARELLQRLAKENLLGSRDQLDLGIVLLVESQKKNKQALAYIEAARKTIGDHPRVLAALALALQKTERIDEASELLEQVQIALQGGEADPVVQDLVKRARKGLEAFIEAQLRRERRSRSRRTTIVVSSDLAASEIVSGEIGAGDQAQIDNPTTSFRPAGTVISSKSVDGELTNEERNMLNIPDSRTRRAEEARASAFSIEEDAVTEEELSEALAQPSTPAKPATAVAPATPVAVPAKPEVPVVPVAPATPVSVPAKPAVPGAVPAKPAAPVVPAKPVTPAEPAAPSLVDSVLTAIATGPVAAAAPISLINPVTAVPSTVDADKLASALPLIEPASPPPPPPARSASPRPPGPEVDVPVFRRKQTLAAVPATPDRPNALGSLPTGGNSGMGSAPPLSTLPVAGGSKPPALPTRRPETGGAPKTTPPLFRAPNAGKAEGEDDSERR